MATALLKVSPEAHRLLAESAHYFGSSNMNFVDLAAREYVKNHRAELADEGGFGDGGAR